MTSMIERVARAINKALSERSYGLYDFSGHSGSGASPHIVKDERTGVFLAAYANRDEAHAHYERLCRQCVARAAIEAMREPTEEMVKAGTGNITLQSIYRDMIDAALKEQP